MKNLYDQPPEILLQYAKVREGELFTIKTSGGLFEKEKELSGIIQAVKFLVKHNINIYWCHGAGVGISTLLNDFDRTGNRITPPEKMSEIVKLDTELTQQILDQLPDAKKVPYTEFLSKKVSPHNATAKFHSITEKGLEIFKTHPLIISDHLGIDIETGEPTNINADEKSSKGSSFVNATKIFFVGNTNGVLDYETKKTIPDINPHDINPNNYKAGMGIKMKYAKEAALNGIDVHLVSDEHPEDIISDSLSPMGIPERVTKVSLNETQETWLNSEEINETLINQLITLIKYDSNLLPRTKEEILKNIKNWHLLIEDRVIKGAFEIKKYKDKNIWEMGGLIKPEFMKGNNIGKKLFSKFEELRTQTKNQQAFALVKSNNHKGIAFFRKNNAIITAPPKWLLKKRDTKERIYFEWK